MESKEMISFTYKNGYFECGFPLCNTKGCLSKSEILSHVFKTFHEKGFHYPFTVCNSFPEHKNVEEALNEKCTFVCTVFDLIEEEAIKISEDEENDTPPTIELISNIPLSQQQARTNFPGPQPPRFLPSNRSALSASQINTCYPSNLPQRLPINGLSVPPCYLQRFPSTHLIQPQRQFSCVERYVCFHCKSIFGSSFEVMQHIRYIHYKGVIHCDVCNFTGDIRTVVHHIIHYHKSIYTHLDIEKRLLSTITRQLVANEENVFYYSLKT